MKIITHNSSFHTDDIFACATLLLVYPDAEVVRSRDPEIIEAADIVFDVGGIYDQSLGKFDHHQSGGAGKRENGIPYASFGLVWKEFGIRVCSSETVVKNIDLKLCQPIDAIDNGVEITKAIYENVFSYTITDFLGSYKKIEEPTEDDLYNIFIKLVGIAKELLEREIANQKIIEKFQKEVVETYNSSSPKEIIIFEKRIERHIWRPVLINFKEPIYVIYPSLEGGWKVEAVPITLNSFESRKKFPISWVGKTGEKLAIITGISDAIFSHNNGFMTAVKSKEGAIALAKKALES